jgi:hypothetical protein
MGIKWATATDEEIDEITRQFAFETALAESVESGVLEVVGRRKDGELVYRRTDFGFVGDRRKRGTGGKP